MTSIRSLSLRSLATAALVFGAVAGAGAVHADSGLNRAVIEGARDAAARAQWEHDRGYDRRYQREYRRDDGREQSYGDSYDGQTRNNGSVWQGRDGYYGQGRDRYYGQGRDERQRDQDRHAFRHGPNGDLDRDGIRNRDDRDRDGDGVRNRHDRAPDDARFR